MDNTKSPTGLFGINLALHGISASLGGVWIADLVSSSGGMTPLAWFETGASVLAIALGLSGCSYIAMKHIPALPQPPRGRVKAGFLAIYGAIALVLGVAAASVLASPAGERAHQEHSLQEMKTETELHRRAAAKIQNRTPLLNDCIANGHSMGGQEGATGAFSREGGDVGRVAITLQNIASGCEIARDSVYANRAYLTRQFARADRILIDMRRVIDSENDRRKKMVDVRKLADEWQRIMRGIKDALAIETMLAASEALSKDWHAAGLPVAAANAITQNFDGIADALIEGLDDIAAPKVQPLPGLPVVSNVALLGMYPDATMGAVAIGAIIELIPLGGILLGFAIMERGNTPRVPTQPSLTARPEIVPRPKRQYKRRAPKGDA
jgi:hypothetical protein